MKAAPCSGQNNFSGPAVEQQVPENALKILDLLAQGRCREMQTLCCATEVQFFRNRNRVAEKPKFDKMFNDWRCTHLAFQP